MRNVKYYKRRKRNVEKGHLETLKESANTSSAHTRRVLLSFLLFTVYILLAALSVDHLQIFRETSLSLPIVKMPIPLKWFGIGAPLAVVGFHLYLLIQMRLTEIKVMNFCRYLNRSCDRDEIALHSSMLYPFVYTQAILYKHHERGFEALVRIPVALSVVILPAITLITIQAVFIPYHSVVMTTLNRFAILLYVIALFWFWNTQPWARKRSKGLRLKRLSLYGVFAAILIVSSTVLVTIPGESLDLWWMDRNEYNQRWSPWGAMMAGEFRAHPPFRRNLYLPAANAYAGKAAPEELAASYAKSGNWEHARAETDSRLNLVGRNFEYAFFGGANFRDTNFSQANLFKAYLKGANLSGANFTSSNLAFADLSGTTAIGASFHKADLERAKLVASNLRGSLISYANLGGVQGTNAICDGVSFEESVLKGAILSSSSFAAASFYRTDLRGAALIGCDLTASEMVYCDVRGAILRLADLTLTNISHSSFDAAELFTTFFDATYWIRYKPTFDRAFYAASMRERSVGLDVDGVEAVLIKKNLSGELFKRTLSRIREDLGALNPRKRMGETIDSKSLEELGVVRGYDDKKRQKVLADLACEDLTVKKNLVVFGEVEETLQCE